MVAVVAAVEDAPWTASTSAARTVRKIRTPYMVLCLCFCLLMVFSVFLFAYI